MSKILNTKKNASSSPSNSSPSSQLPLYPNSKPSLSSKSSLHLNSPPSSKLPPFSKPNSDSLQSTKSPPSSNSNSLPSSKSPSFKLDSPNLKKKGDGQLDKNAIQNYEGIDTTFIPISGAMSMFEDILEVGKKIFLEKSLYDILEIEKGADENEVERLFRNKIQSIHSEKDMEEARYAVDYLDLLHEIYLNPEDRQSYDDNKDRYELLTRTFIKKVEDFNNNLQGKEF